MKKLGFILTCVLFSSVALGQSETYSQQLSVGTKHAEKTSETNSLDTGAAITPSEVLSKLDREIEAIEVKIAWVKKNEEEDALARKNGWYDMAYKRLEALTEQKKKLISEMKE